MFHDQVKLAVDLTAIMNSHDVGMSQRRHQLGFSVKCQERRMAVERRIQNLDGHRSLQTQLGCPKDLAGPALADFLLDLKAGDFPGVLGGFHFHHRI